MFYTYKDDKYFSNTFNLILSMLKCVVDKVLTAKSEQVEMFFMVLKSF